MTSDIVWTVTAGPQPNLLVTALEVAPTDGMTEQLFGEYTVGPPATSRWVVPLDWNCSKARATVAKM